MWHLNSTVNICISPVLHPQAFISSVLFCSQASDGCCIFKPQVLFPNRKKNEQKKGGWGQGCLLTRPLKWLQCFNFSLFCNGVWSIPGYQRTTSGRECALPHPTMWVPGFELRSQVLFHLTSPPAMPYLEKAFQKNSMHMTMFYLIANG